MKKKPQPATRRQKACDQLTKPRSLVLSPRLVAAVTAAAAADHRTASNWMRCAIEEKLDREARK